MRRQVTNSWRRYESWNIQRIRHRKENFVLDNIKIFFIRLILSIALALILDTEDKKVKPQQLVQIKKFTFIKIE